MSWTDIDNSDIAAGKPVKTSLMTAYRDNNIANADKPVATPVNFSSTASTSFQGSSVSTCYLYCPEDALVLHVRSALWTTAGRTATGRFRLSRADGVGTSVDVDVTSTATAKGSVGGTADKTWDFTGLNSVSGTDFRGQALKLETFTKADASATVTIQNTSWPPSRFARS